MRHRSIHVLLAIAGIAGIAGLFVPFTNDISPLMAVRDRFLWMLAVPFFLSIAASRGSARWLLSGSFSRIETSIAYAVSGAAAAVTLAFIVKLFSEGDAPSALLDWGIVITPVAILLSGVWLLIRDWRANRLHGFGPVMAVEIAYLGNAAFCLFLFFDFTGWQIGAYLTLVTSVAYLLQIILVHSQSRRRAGAD